MASNYTTNYNLCQWQPTDQVQRTDFNADNLKIDTVLASKAEATALSSLTQTVNQKASQSALDAAIAAIPKVAYSTYTGDGTRNRKISLPFTPKAVFVNPVNGCTFDDKEGYQYCGGLAVQGSPLKWEEYTDEDVHVLEIVSGGFKVWCQTYGSYFLYCSRTNDSGRIYNYFAIG